MQRLLAIVVAALVTFPAIAQPIGQARANELRVLFIGNSLTYFNEMPWLTQEVAASLKVTPPLRTSFQGRSGATLRQQWDRGRALRAIREGKYAWVILQPQSTEIVRNPEETFRYARMFDAEIRKSGAKTMLFLTWAPLTGKHDQAAYNRQFAKLAKELGAAVAPVGIAWETLRGEGIELFDTSGLHPNLAGSYLSACVFVAAIYDRSPAGATHTFETNFAHEQFYRDALVNERLGPATAAAIQREAWAAVRAQTVRRP